MNLKELLDPILEIYAQNSNFLVKQRLMEKILEPILESNVTEEKLEFDRTTLWDGGKLKEETREQIMEMLNKKFKFANFNILLFAQESVLKHASGLETLESNWDGLYSLYNKALNLEPEPEEKEPTFTERMMMNRVQSIVTKKMEKRERVHKRKREAKVVEKANKYLG